MSYQKLDGTVHNDYRFVPDGTYTDRNSRPFSFGKKGSEGKVRKGTVCPSCGMVRSVMNRCDCNS